MREILFRGKRLDNGEWVEGCYTFSKKNSNCLIWVQSEDCAEYWHTLPVYVDHLTVGQFTGLLDKNGNKIFEGDIVTFDDIYFWTVTYKDFSWQVVCEDCWHRLEQADHYRIEVVGHTTVFPEE